MGTIGVSISRSTFQYMGVMTLTTLSGLYGFIGLHDEQAGIVLTVSGYIAGIAGMKIRIRDLQGNKRKGHQTRTINVKKE